MAPPGSSGYQGPQVTVWTVAPDLADPAIGEGYVAVRYRGETTLFQGRRTTGHIALGAFALFHSHGNGERANALLLTAEDLAAFDGD